MPKPRSWRWVWRADDSWSFPFGLIDEGGPSLDEAWTATRLAIYRHASEIYEMCMAFDGATAAISGSVTSERTKAQIGSLIALHGLSVRNELDVRAPFKPATDIDYLDGEDRTPAAARQTDTVSRDAAIEADHAPVVGEPFEFTVGLRQTPQPETEGPAVAMKGVSPDWTVLEIAVNVRSSHLSFEAGAKAGIIRLRRDGDPDPCRFVGVVASEAAHANTVEIWADFTYERRHGGSVRRAFEVKRATPREQPSRPAVLGSPRFEVGVEPPTLMIRIVGNGRPGSYDWHLFAPVDVKGVDRRYETVDLGDLRAFARDLLEQCPDLRPGRHINHLRGVGERIWSATPGCFRELYAAMRDQHGNRFPIQLYTDEPYVPWELMYPTGLSTTAEHLCITHPIARWFAEMEGRRRPILKGGQIVSFTPSYGGGRTLRSAQDEGAWLAEHLGATRHDAAYDDFMGFLGEAMPEQAVGVMHFAGHGSSKLDPGAGGTSGLELTDGWVTEADLHSGLTLGERDGSVVVLNACSAAVPDVDLGCVAGFPAQFARRSFGAVLAPIWAVRDAQASQVVCDQIKYLVGGLPLGASMRDARAVHKNASSTPFAYICYGDVMATMRQPA